MSTISAQFNALKKRVQKSFEDLNTNIQKAFQENHKRFEILHARLDTKKKANMRGEELVDKINTRAAFAKAMLESGERDTDLIIKTINALWEEVNKPRAELNQMMDELIEKDKLERIEAGKASENVDAVVRQMKPENAKAPVSAGDA